MILLSKVGIGIFWSNVGVEIFGNKVSVVILSSQVGVENLKKKKKKFGVDIYWCNGVIM